MKNEGDKKRFWIGFNRVYGIGPSRLDNLLSFFGDIEDAWNASAIDLEKAKLAPRYVKALLEARELLDLDQEMQKIEEAGFHVVTWHDDNYPERLREISAPPPVLFVWGELDRRDRWAAAVVQRISSARRRTRAHARRTPKCGAL